MMIPSGYIGNILHDTLRNMTGFVLANIPLHIASVFTAFSIHYKIKQMKSVTILGFLSKTYKIKKLNVEKEGRKCKNNYYSC